MSEEKNVALDADQPGKLVVPILGATSTAGNRYLAPESDPISVESIEEYRDHFGRWPSLSPSDNDVLERATHCFVLRGLNVSRIEDGAAIDSGAWARLTCLVNALTLSCAYPVTYAESAILVDPPGGTPETPSAFVAIRRDFAERLDSVTRFDGYHANALDTEQWDNIMRHARELLNGPAAVRVAAERLTAARQRPGGGDDVVVDLCVGIEALLGTGRDEISHRIALRSAAILSMKGWGASFDIYRAVRDLYAYRSQVVHGSPGPYKQVELTFQGEMIHAVRFALAALSTLLRAFLDDHIKAREVDERFIFAALDAQVESHED